MWYNNRQGSQAIFARLDRTVVNHLWLANYPDVILIHPPIIGSDHAPILLNTYPLTKKYYKRFKFEAKLLLYDNLFDIIRDLWSLFVKDSPTYQLKRQIFLLQSITKNWKVDCFSNKELDYIVYLKNWKILKPKLCLILLLLNLWSKEHDLRKKILVAHVEQEIYWVQRAKKDKFSLGDKNTRNFSLWLLSACKKIIYENFLMRMIFGQTIKFLFCRSFTENSTKHSRSISICILIRLSLYLEVSLMQTMHALLKMLMMVTIFYHAFVNYLLA